MTRGDPVRGRAGELVCTAPFPSMPVAFWNDPDGAKYRAAYFEYYPNVVAPRRLGRADVARRNDHLRPQRCDAQPGRRAHRHGGDLPAGRAAARRSSRASSIGQERDERRRPTSASCCSCGSRRGVALDDALRDRIRAQIRDERDAAPRAARRSSRWPTSRARSAARSPSSPCATSCTVGR